MTQNLQSAYLTAKAMSASTEELRLMLLDGAVRFTRQAREGLIASNPEGAFNGFHSARSILLELAHSIAPETNEDLRAKITGVYMFLYRRLVDANLEKSPAIVDEVLKILEYERETWALYLEKLARERAPGASAHEAAIEGQASGERPTLCIQA